MRREKPLGAAVAGVLPLTDLVVSAHARLLARPDGRSDVDVTTRLHAADTYVLPASGRIEVLCIALDDRGRTRGTTGGTFDARSSAVDLETPPVRLEQLRPGRHQLRVAVRSVTIDRVGSVFLDVVIPPRP